MVALILILLALVTLIVVVVVKKDVILEKFEEKATKKDKKQKTVPETEKKVSTEVIAQIQETLVPTKPSTVSIESVPEAERSSVFGGRSSFGSMGFLGKPDNNQYVCSGRKLLERDVPTLVDQFNKCSDDPECNFVMYDKDNDNLYTCEGIISQTPHTDMGENLYFYRKGSYAGKDDYNIYENDGVFDTLHESLKPQLTKYGYDYGGWTMGTGLCASTNIRKYENIEEGLEKAFDLCTESPTCTDFLYDIDNNTVFTCEVPDGDREQTYFIRANQYTGFYDLDVDSMGKRVKFVKDFSKQVIWDLLNPFCDDPDCYDDMLLGFEYEGKGVKCKPSLVKKIKKIDACYLNSGVNLVSREKLTGCTIDGEWRSINNDAHELCTSDPDCTHVSIFASEPNTDNQVSVMMETHNCDKDDDEFVPTLLGPGEHEVETEMYEGHMKFSDLYKRKEAKMIEEGEGKYHPHPKGLEYPSYEKEGEIIPIMPPYSCRKFTDTRQAADDVHACHVKTLSGHKPINYLAGCWDGNGGKITKNWVCTNKQYPNQRTSDWEACPYQMPANRRWVPIKDETGKVVRCMQPPETPESERLTLMSAHCDIILNDIGTTNGCVDSACQWNNWMGSWVEESDESVCDSFTKTPAQWCNEGCITTGLETDVVPNMCARNGSTVYRCLKLTDSGSSNLGGYGTVDEDSYDFLGHVDLEGSRVFKENYDMRNGVCIQDYGCDY